MALAGEGAEGRRRASPARAVLLALIAMAAMPNGLYFSPLFDSVLYYVPRAASAFFLRGQEVTFYLTGFVLWLFTLVISGIPAAAYERLRGLRDSSAVSLVIWLVVALVLSVPSLMALAELMAEP
ncbi:MAG: hypothetical protein NW223_05225 [Hyphomicrobiaceae bacterium]|nr:hypothetical protein [Hyphomicrobiaceae bacterium]